MMRLIGQRWKCREVFELTDTNRSRTLSYNNNANIQARVLFNFEREFGGDSKVDTPVPMPNTEVKHFNADDS